MPLQAAHISEFRIRHDDCNGLTRIDCRATADRYEYIRTTLPAESNPFLHIGDGRIRLDLVIYLVIDVILLQQLRDLCRDLEFHQILIRYDHDLFQPAILDLMSDFLNGPRTKIRRFIQDDSVCHKQRPLCFHFCDYFHLSSTACTKYLVELLV